jgi:N-acetylglutamate synthase/N-acetylornithine aminotransferase
LYRYVSAGVFTQNRVAAAPVLYCRDVINGNETARAVLVNAVGLYTCLHKCLRK